MRFIAFCTWFVVLAGFVGPVEAASCPSYASNASYHWDADISAAYSHCQGTSMPVTRMTAGGYVYGEFVGCEIVNGNGFMPRYKDFMIKKTFGCEEASMGLDQYLGGPHYWSVGCPTGTAWNSATSSCEAVNTPKNLGSTCDVPGTTCGNPINVAIGNKYQAETDLRISGQLEFVRHYNSQSAVAGPLGPKWTHTYLRKITLIGGDLPTVTASRADGAEIDFQRIDGQWRPDADVTASLGEITDEFGQLTGWTYAERDTRVVERFDALGRLIAISGPDADQLVLSYNNGISEGNENDLRLTRVQAEDGRAITFDYEGGRLIRVVDPAGGQYAYAYDASGRLVSVTYPGGAQRRYHYNEPNHTSGLNQPLAMTGITGEDNQRFSYFRYDTSGRAYQTGHSLAADQHVVEYKPDNSVVVTTPLGAKQPRVFETLHGVRRASRVTDTCSGCASRTTTYSYDASGHVDRITDALGHVTDYDHDARGLALQVTSAATDTAGRKRTIQTDWHPGFAVPIERRTLDSTGALVARQIWTYNTRGQPLTATTFDPATGRSRTTTSTYCEQSDITAGTCPLPGLVTSTDGPRTDLDDRTTYIYYPSDDPGCAASPTTCPHRKGDLWMVMDAVGHVTETLRYDGAGRVLSVKDPNGVVTDFEYHPRGWLTARKQRGADDSTETDDRITRIEYYPTGLVQKVTLPDGSFTAYTYDAAHRLTDIADGEGNTIHYTLDNAGNRTKEDTLGHTGTVLRTLSRVYNQLGQLQTHKDAYAHATGYTFDANGNTDTVTDALNRVTDHDYDPLNRLSQTIQNVGGLNVTTRFQYDAQDQLTEVVDPKGLSTKYSYNGLGDLTQLESPDTGVTSYNYDSAGNRRSQTDARGITAGYGYDALNRLVAIAYPDSRLDVAYAYDTVASACTPGETYAAGRLSRLTDGSGETQYCYDRFGHLIRKVQTTGGQTHTVRYGYTKAGQLSALEYPDGTVADYVRDALGRTTEIGVTRPNQPREVLLTAAGYYPFGPVAEWVYGNGRLIQRTLNQNYQPGIIQDQNSGGLSLGYEFDPVGNLAKLRRGDQSEPPLRSYGYDALNRLTETRDGTTNALLQGYSYDATGNRTSATEGGVTTPYTIATSSHHLLSVGNEARTYDANGNTTAIGTTRAFVYNAANRMSAVEQGGVTAMAYAYNGKGEQVRRANGTDAITTIYDEAGHWLGEYDSNGQPIQQVVWLDDLPVGLIVGSTAANQPLHYIEADALGTPRVVIEAQRNVAVWEWPLAGEAFGKNEPNEDPDGDGTRLVFNMRFAGQRYDAASGLNQNGARDYEPGTGRFPESDQAGLMGGISTYGYALSNPLTWIDPDGMQAQPKPQTPPPGTGPGRFVPPGMPPANATIYGPTRGTGTAGLLRMCMHPIVAGIVLMAMPGNIGQTGAACQDDPNKQRPECRNGDNSCPPCRLVDGTVVLPGTIGYRLDIVPPAKPHHPYTGDHYNLFRANQNPNNCQCFWQPIGAADAAGGQPPPPGSIPIKAFAN